ncbi:unnamed protein product [Calicophoron daubneyi]|uniref:C3H1-type domain-containing protein n=1 Tax=Calicophoron daubneyi TaxID=300641 RepID=A0AAV2T392_CALDB
MIMVTNNENPPLGLYPKNTEVRQEKPRHLKYLNEFRTQQCVLFLEQQCQYHRPYTCFHWHFPNQKRRRPFKRPDGTFNYNPDVYCDKYDETTGTCVDGDDCPYAHRNAGDTERRYHPRYFKTGNCIYETTEGGACVKNGLHCAFAHGPDDIRLPVYDIREMQDASSKFTINLPASLEKERVLSEDPKWNEMFHVLACYKTEMCKKPPRMCRQGYSCPFYHNGKDKRRAPDKWRYRSTPCPIVRPNDEWLDSSLCESGDLCAYCHTRTEQQFHPEIYKSTKCNDVINSGYCPRGPFCAFAHCDSEMTIGRDFLTKLQQDQLSVSNAVSSPGETLGLILSGVSNCTVSSTSEGSGAQPVGSRVFTNNLNPKLMTGLPLNQPPNSAPGQSSFYQRSGGQMLSFAPAECKSGSMGSPTGHLNSVNRGRRLGRCSSPHHNMGMWQSSNQQGMSSGADRLTQLAFMNTFPPGCTADPNISAGLPSFSSAAGQHQLHLPFYQHRLQGALSSSVGPITNSVRDKGRHRSGSSVSSSDGLTTLNSRDLMSPPSRMPLPVVVCTSTYPGRCGGFGVRQGGVTSLNQLSKQPFRSTPKKQLHQSTYITSSSGPQQNSGIVRCVGESDPQSVAVPPTVSLLQGTLWNSANISSSGLDSANVDPFFSPPWPWPFHVDSGNNSETSATENDVVGVYDFGVTGGSSCTQTTKGSAAASLLEESNRDSGLVLDYNLPASSSLADAGLESNSGLPRASQSPNVKNSPLPTVQPMQTTVKEGCEPHSVREGIRELLKKSDPGHQIVRTDPPRVPSGLFDDVYTFCQRVGCDGRSAGDNFSTGLNSYETGFQSPLDDILLNAQCPVDNSDVQTVKSTPIGFTESSPSNNGGGSNPVSIPGRTFDEANSRLVEFHSDTGRPALAPSNSLRFSQDPRTSQQNTWPVSFVEAQQGVARCDLSDISPPAASQTSQSFSPVVGAPLARFNGNRPVFELGSSVGSGSANAGRGTFTQASASSDPSCIPGSTASKPEVCSDCSPPLQPEQGLKRSGGKRGGLQTPSGNFADLPQSPILISSPFNNPSYDLERLTLQRELDEVRQRLDSKEGELEVLKRQRDIVTEHLRDSLGVIRQIFSSFQISSNDLSKPLFVNTDTGTGSGQSTGYGVAPCTGSESSPMPVEQPEQGRRQDNTQVIGGSGYEKAPSDTNGSGQSHSPNALCDIIDKSQLEQQQEALTALFANPFITALLNNSNAATTTPDMFGPKFPQNPVEFVLFSSLVLNPRFKFSEFGAFISRIIEALMLFSVEYVEFREHF